MTAAAYVNPFLGDTTVTPERIDQGQDFALSPGESIKAMGDAIIKGIMPNWYQGQPYLWYQLTSGPQAGKYVYIAEQITPTVAPGTRVKAGQTIATYAGSGTGLETGYATATGATLAHDTGGYTEGVPTAAGTAFAKFLEGLPAGKTAQQLLHQSIGETEAEPGHTESGPSSLAQGIVNDVIGWAEPSALKLLLYVVFIFGGVALAGYGLATMLKPSPPSITGGIKKAGKAAGLAAA